MGVAVARMLDTITKTMITSSNSINSSNIKLHCVGHSLGAHICGFTGATLHNISHVALTRISGLDPAGPMFAIDVPYPFNWLDISPQARLNKNDASFVDVIHTDGKARYFERPNAFIKYRKQRIARSEKADIVILKICIDILNFLGTFDKNVFFL